MAKDSYILRYLPIAVEDLISIFDWISLDSPNEQRRLSKNLINGLDYLNPPRLMGGFQRRKLKKLGYRILILGDYLVFTPFVVSS